MDNTIDGGRKVTVASIASRKAFWELDEVKRAFPLASKAAQTLLGIHVTTGAAERNWSAWSLLYRNPLRNGLDPANAQMMVFIKVNQKVFANEAMNWVVDELVLLRYADEEI